MMEKRLLVIFAHPDDESFGPAGTLAHYARSGARVHLLTATKGEAGKNATGLTEESLGAMREKELLKAAKIIGLEHVEFMGYMDKTLTDLEPHRPVEKIVNYMERFQPQVIITFGPTGISRHPDHVTVHHWAMQAFKISDYPQKLYYFTIPKERLIERYPEFPNGEGDITTILNVQDYIEVKKAAILCHETQRYSIDRLYDFSKQGGRPPIPVEENFILAANRLDYEVEGLEADLFTGIDTLQRETVG